MMYRFFSTTLLFALPLSVFSQQIVRGAIKDIDSKAPIPFAAIVIHDLAPIIATTSDLDGNFEFENVPI